jgi:hypothetical protein
MNKKEVKIVLDDVKDYMLENPDKVLASWSGLCNDPEHKHIRADLFFLNMLSVKDGEVTFRRVRPATISKGRLGGPELLYSVWDLVRVNTGRRTGQVLPVDMLADDETYSPAGLIKKLEYTTYPSGFHVKRQSDLASVSLMGNLLEDVQNMRPRTLASISPDLLLVRGKHVTGDLKARRTAENARWIRGHDVEGEDLHKQGMEVAKQYMEESGPEHISYPFDRFFGKGVVAASVNTPDVSMGKWYDIICREAVLPGIVFECDM